MANLASKPLYGVRLLYAAICAGGQCSTFNFCLSTLNYQPLAASFAHPAEETLARILDYYGIAWEYEPRTFPLQWDENGNVVEAFAPDFYLPDQDQYIELTTLRPHLATQKNRKLRRMEALYPNVKIKLLRRRDVRELFVKYGLDQEAALIQGTEAQKEKV